MALGTLSSDPSHWLSLSAPREPDHLVQVTAMGSTFPLTPLEELSQGPWDSHCPCQDPQGSALSASVQFPTSEKGEAAPRNKASLALQPWAPQ